VKAEKTNESVLIKYETMFENDLNFFIDLFLLLLYMCWRPFKGAPVGGGSGLEGGGETPAAAEHFDSSTVPLDSCRLSTCIIL
jgi:hypothetical protein